MLNDNRLSRHQRRGLTNAQKERIREEEVYRLEVRRALESQARPSHSTRLLAILNSGLGLFLLSTIFVSGFSWCYTEIASAAAKRAALEETGSKLRLELANRLDTIQQIERRFRGEHHSVIRSAIFGFKLGANVNPSWLRLYSPMFPEYGERSFASLLWQLEAQSKAPEKAHLAALRRRAASFEDYYDRLVFSTEPSYGRNTDGAPYEYYSLTPVDAKSFHKEVMVPFATLRIISP